MASTVRRLLRESAESDGSFTLHVHPVPGWQTRSHSDRPLYALYAANPPDVVLAPAHSIGPLARADLIAPVSQFSMRNVEESWNEETLISGARTLGLAGGRRWAMPVTGMPVTLLCRIDLIREAGYGHLLETPHSLTWEQFRKFARADTPRER